MQIPEELVNLVQQQRVIPFIGAGFSVGLGLPNWEDLLKDLAEETEGTSSFDSLMEDTNSDLLQVAEYLYLKNDKHIGPMRHSLEKGLSANVDPTTSGVHIELINLEAPQIYTTNYDDLIEEAFKRTDQPVRTVVLPKDVALSNEKKTQVVKYHGDLRHEDTLVLTESAYYKRLDFESPMDLKFRSDLLGKSVLFMGYSFRDINIRIIWFKLMEMMKDIPEADRVPSYIVRPQPNAVLEELYRAVGLQTIVLSEETGPLSKEQVTELHGEFLMRLVDQAGKPTGSDRIVSEARIAFLDRVMGDMQARFSHLGGARAHRRGINLNQILRSSSDMKTPLKQIPVSLLSRAEPVIRKYVDKFLDDSEWKYAVEVMEKFGPSTETTSYFARIIASPGNDELRAELLESNDIDWEKVWKEAISVDIFNSAVRTVTEEVAYHQQSGIDFDLAFAVDILARALDGQIFDTSKLDSADLSRGQAAFEAAGDLYPTVKEYRPSPGEAPNPKSILDEISTAEKARMKGNQSARRATRANLGQSEK